MIDHDPSPVTEVQLFSWFCQLSPLHGHLIGRGLDLAERRRLGGLLLPFGPGLVLATAQALSDRPGLFPDAPVTGPDLLAEQKVALAWLCLRNRLRAMTQLADDAYLAAQARATHTAWSFVTRAAQRAPREVPGADVPVRNLLLVPALLILSAYHQASKKVRARKRAAVPAPPPSAARARARDRAAAELRAHGKAALHRAFERALRARRDIGCAGPAQTENSFTLGTWLPYPSVP